MKKEEKILFKIEEAAERIGIGQQKLRELSEIKGFPVIKIGVKKLIIINKVEQWFYEHKGEII